MKKIAFDIMGGDKGIEPAIKAAEEFVATNPDFEIYLVGNELEIQKYLKNSTNIIVVDEPEVSIKTNNLRAAASEKNSMNKAIDLLKVKEVDAVLSAGESANILTSSSLKLKRLPNVSRPAFMPIFPQLKKDKSILFLDAGANVEIKAHYLVEWAKIATAFYDVLFKNNKPSIAILNIGIEENKGLDFHQEAFNLLKEEKNLNFIGFIEPREILNSPADIILTDGYGGNIALKSMEGAVGTFSKLLKQELTASIFRKIPALLLKPAFKSIRSRFDYRNVGAAWIIGVNGIVLKAHGSSDEKAFLSALNQVKKALANNVFSKIQK
ncbi:phosphate acyltransferase PlsX [Candidatus Mycoplasma pogonae]